MVAIGSYITTNQGTTLLEHNGFTYWKTNYVSQNNKMRWYCSSRKSCGCPVVLSCCGTRIISANGTHNHEHPIMHVDNYGRYYRIYTKAAQNIREDLVQCVPTRKGHQILYKGYTYVFKSRLQCGAEQWCCSYRQKTEKEELPEWVSIYFLKKNDINYRCNICDAAIQTTGNSLELLEHIKKSHEEVIELHKNPDSPVGFRIEFLQLNVLNEDDGEEKRQSVILGEVCEGPTEEVASTVNMKAVVAETDPADVQYVLIPSKKKYKRESEPRKRSWVWKYFDKLSTIIFRCNICNVVLSIKGCNTNNMNRHVRTKHPSIYRSEVGIKGENELDLGSEVETPFAVKTEEISHSDKDYDETSIVEADKRGRRSWVWSYFKKLTGTQAQCKLCNRNITHGGNATGNMNRHIKMIHKEVYAIGDQISDDHNWVWKVFESDEDDFYSCKICHFKCMKFDSILKSIDCIRRHLKVDHGVVSGDQIITSVDCDTEDHPAV